MQLTATVQKTGSFDALNKQMRFAMAVALTKTAKDGQSAVLDSLKENFTLRGNWFNPSNKFGIRIKSAKKDNLTAQVSTLADWLKLHEEDSIKTPRGKMIAIPTANVRRNKKDIVVKSQRPNSLRGKNTFVIETASGPVIFQRKGKGKREKLIPLYTLVPNAKIKKQSTFFAPIGKTARENFQRNFNDAVTQAFATAR